MNRLILLALAGFFLYACAQPNPQTPNDASPDPANTASQTVTAPALTFEPQRPTFDLPKGILMEVQTLIAKGGAVGVSENINKTLSADYDVFILGLGDDQAADNPAKALKELAARYKEFGEPNGIEWGLELRDTVYLASPQIVSISRDVYEFLGGAHPSTMTTFYNFDAATGRRLEAKDIFTDLTALLPVVEKQFKAHWAEVLQDANGNLENAGFSFDGGKFTLPQNIGFTNNEVIFYYNTYEIGPYVMGPTDLRIPKANIINLMKFK